MTGPRRKSQAHKSKSTVARVIAVKHPPIDGMPQAVLAGHLPYVTDNGFTEFFEELAVIVQPFLERSAASADEATKAAQEVLKHIEKRLPPVADGKMPVIAAVALSLLGKALYKGAYRATKANPIYAIEAFITFHHLGLYPPLWVLEWLNDAFHAYMRSKGGDSLDALLGVKRRRGQAPIIKEMRAISIETQMMREIAVLTYLGISIENAAAMVAARLEAVKVPCPSPETLAERYSKRGFAKVYKRLKFVSAAITPEKKKEILAAYPRHAIPQKLR